MNHSQQNRRITTMANIKDIEGLLEGAGKGRRHFKLRGVADVDAKHLSSYLKLAYEAS